jgi:NAD(P)H dehydrogenase (quinone)
MIKIAIVFFSAAGSTEKIAKAVAKGAGNFGAEVSLMPCKQVDMGYLDAADAIIFGCPTYMGSVPAEYKVFMDATSEAWSTRKWCDKVAAGFTNSAALSGDKLGTLIQLALFAFQQGMVWVGLDIMAGKTENGGAVPLNRVGGWLGLMTQINGVTTDEKLVECDLATAEYFGKRVADFTQRLMKKR